MFKNKLGNKNFFIIKIRDINLRLKKLEKSNLKPLKLKIKNSYK